MGPRLFGWENEYALRVTGADGKRVELGSALERIGTLARKRLRHLPGPGTLGIFLENAGRLYVDCGAHQEWATPECANPWDVVRYLLAGERHLAELAREVCGQGGIANAAFYRCNVDYSSGTTWGAHESVLHRGDPQRIAAEILPFLISRVIYGAGGWTTKPFGFTLSPRVAHLRRVSSPHSTHERGILHTKDEPLASGGVHRLHILCGDSLCSRRVNWIKAASTVAVVALAEAGVRPAHGVTLSAPVDALHRFATDPTCRVKASTARGACTAIDLQRHYLRLAHDKRDEPYMPPWTPQLIPAWGELLDRLERAPDAVQTTVDWAIKLRLFRRHVEQSGLEWDSLVHWEPIVSAWAAIPGELRHRIEAGESTARLMKSPATASHLRPLEQMLKAARLAWQDIPTLARVRLELFELDIRFGELGESGIFNTLTARGVLDHEFAGVDGIEHAMSNPPATGRANLRGRVIRRCCREPDVHVCDWTYVQNARGDRVLDLSSPWQSSESWGPPPGPRDGPPEGFARLRDALVSVRNAFR